MRLLLRQELAQGPAVRQAVADYARIQIMARTPNRHALQNQSETPSSEVITLADLVGNSEVSLSSVVTDFLQIVPNPILAGGFAMAHHGYVRATVDIDVIAVGSVGRLIGKFEAIGYKHESVSIPIGRLELLSKGNKGVDFLHLESKAFCESIVNRAVEGTLAGSPVRYVSLEDLIVLKMLAVKGRTGRYDQGDLDALVSNSYDKIYVEGWRKKFGLC